MTSFCEKCGTIMIIVNYTSDTVGIDVFNECPNCSFKEKIEDSNNLIYSLTKKEKINIDEYTKLYNKDLFYHTRFYTCLNKSCDTHKNSEKKDAIIIKNDIDLSIKYECLSCGKQFKI